MAPQGKILGEVVIAMLVGALFLWVPGTLLLLAIRLQKLTAFALAPVISVFMYAMMGVIYGFLGIFSNWLNVSMPVILISVIAFGISMITRAKYPSHTEKGNSFPDVIIFVGYLLFGFAIVLIIFISNLSSPEAVLQEFDNIHHLGVLRTFLDTGQWSFLDVSAYGGIDEDIRAINAGGFYPAAWHVVAAMLSSSLHVSNACAANATNALFAALVFPAGMFAMLRLLFKGRVIPLVFGVFLSFAFAAFPWKFLIWGPLFPNLASFALLPGVIFCFLLVFEEDISKRTRAIAIVLFAIGTITLAITQTNAVFTMAVFLIPFVVVQASKIPICILKKKGRQVKGTELGSYALRILAGTIAIICIGLIWLACYKLPFLQDVVTHVWAPIYTRSEAIEHALLLSFNETQPQYMLGILVIVGIACTLFHRKYLWMSFSYASMIFIFLVCSSSSGSIKQLLGGFWYTDTMRLAASAALFGIPLACLALSWIVEFPMKLIKKKPIGNAVSLIAAFVSLYLIFAPATPLSEALGTKGAVAFMGNRVVGMYGPAAHVYTEEEQGFVERAMEITGDSLILNVPDDGSAFAYGMDGLNVFYRYTGVYGLEDETSESRIIREGLDDISLNDEVARAVDAIGAEYVIKLDQGDQGIRKNRYLASYSEALWEGIDSIDDDTPGFELVLSEDDMRLYRIER